jgi:hypothetical protein
MEENAVNELVRDAVLSQVNDLTQDMKSQVEDAKDKISEHIKEKLKELTSLAPHTSSPPPRPSTPTDPGRCSYAKALINPPSHVNPRLAAREGVHSKQILLEGINPTSKFATMNGLELKTEFNKILKGIGLEGKGVRLVTV